MTKQSSDFIEKLKKRGFTIVEDKNELDHILNKYSASPKSIKKGQYHFYGEVTKSQFDFGDKSVIFYRCNAAFKNYQAKFATIDTFNISSLFSGLSHYVTINGGAVNSKERFNINEVNKEVKIKQYLIDYSVEVLNDSPKNQITWKYIPKKMFMDIGDLACSDSFLNYQVIKKYDQIRDIYTNE